MGHFDLSAIVSALPYLLQTGLSFTLTLTALAAVMGIALGTVLAMLRLSPLKLLAWPAAVYVNVMRSVPLLLVIFWFYFLMPYMGAWVLGQSSPVQVGAFKSAVITFTLFESAYFCEIVRAGIQSVSRGQAAAAMALGMRPAQVMVGVVLPQAFRNMTPAILTRIVLLFQDTSLVYVLSLTDFLGAASKIGQRDGRLVEMYIFVALVYLVICFAASRGTAFLARRNRYQH
ncbi:ABC transporter permease subunit [Xylophilus sp. GW821-FHT01B05]